MGVGRQLISLSEKMAKIKGYWLKERISVNTLTFQADSGDILLFQGNNFSAKLNQIAQASDYGKDTYLQLIRSCLHNIEICKWKYSFI